MTKIVIDQFEAIQVDESDGKRAAVTIRTSNGRIQLPQERQSVGETRNEIMERLLLPCLCNLSALNRKVDGTTKQRRQQLRLGNKVLRSGLDGF